MVLGIIVVGVACLAVFCSYYCIVSEVALHPFPSVFGHKGRVDIDDPVFVCPHEMG
jgi:hypothetical protein